MRESTALRREEESGLVHPSVNVGVIVSDMSTSAVHPDDNASSRSVTPVRRIGI